MTVDEAKKITSDYNKMKSEHRKIKKARDDMQRAQKKRSLARFVNLNSMLGNDWAMIYAILGGRMTGKSYSVTNRMCKLKKKLGKECKCYWLRISETSTKQLLCNKADKLVDPDLKRKYELELTTKGNNVYDHGKPFCEVYPLSMFGKLKGVGFFDKDFHGKYFIVLDEFQLEQGEKRTSFDILYNFLGMLENIARTTKSNIEVWLLGNTLEEASTILKALNFLPEKFGRYYLKRKRAIIDNLEPTEEYLKDRQGSLAQILGGDEMSNYTNELTKDRKLITKQRVTKPQAIVKFAKEKSRWFVLWNGNIIRKYKEQTCKNIISMKPYIDEWYNLERRQMVIDMYDAQSFKFNNLIDKSYFEDELKKIRGGK